LFELDPDSDPPVTLPKLDDLIKFDEPGLSFDPVFDKFELLEDFPTFPSFWGDLKELFILPSPFVFLGLAINGVRLLKPPVFPECTADFTISLIVLSILPLLQILVRADSLVVTADLLTLLELLLLLPSPVIVLRTPLVEKFTRILPIGRDGRPMLPKVKLEFVFITLVTEVVEVVIDAIVTVFVVMVLEDVAKAINLSVSDSEAGDTGSNMELTALLISDTGTVSMSSRYNKSSESVAFNTGIDVRDGLISSSVSVITGIDNGGDFEPRMAPLVNGEVLALPVESICFFMATVSGIRSIFTTGMLFVF
jgi:hypothetical protein